VYATIARSAARSRGESRLETHRKYIDIQLVLEGVDEMGGRRWRTAGNRRERMKRNGISSCLPTRRKPGWPSGPARSRCSFRRMPTPPLVGSGELIKVVVKVAV